MPLEGGDGVYPEQPEITPVGQAPVIWRGLLISLLVSATSASVASMKSDGESSGSLTRPPPGPRGGPAGRPSPTGRTHARMRRCMSH